VLEINVPKPEQKKPRQVQISLSGRPEEAKKIAGADSTDPQLNSADPVAATT
jgi:hypothetical protein